MKPALASHHPLTKFFTLFLLLIAIGCHTSNPRTARLPSVLVRDAAPIFFRGADSPAPDKPGDTDCNSPAHWDGDTLYLFNSSGHPWRSAGPDLFNLSRDYRRSEYNNSANGGRWIECTWLDHSGTLYGWYHNEPAGLCPGTHLTAPKIGAVRSHDNGATWEDLGIVIEAPPNSLRCDTENYYFAGGNGDFCVMLDERERWLYFFVSTYTGSLQNQGVAIARMPWTDRDHPIGKVSKWHNHDWSEPGLNGHVSSIFPAFIDWHRPDAHAFWGPSVHYNSYLRQYVMLLNRAIDKDWTQEGIYVSFNPDLANPTSWSPPTKILDSPGRDRWYPQVLGLNTANRETDKLAGQRARLFVRGTSHWELRFLRPGERLPPRQASPPRTPFQNLQSQDLLDPSRPARPF